jgi:hypothetical protein
MKVQVKLHRPIRLPLQIYGLDASALDLMHQDAPSATAPTSLQIRKVDKPSGVRAPFLFSVQNEYQRDAYGIACPYSSFVVRELIFVGLINLGGIERQKSRDN